MPISRFSGGSEKPLADTTCPPMAISPSVTSSRPAMQRSVVVLPHPLGPSSTMNSPSAISRLTPFTAPTPEYFFTRLRIETPDIYRAPAAAQPCARISLVLPPGGVPGRSAPGVFSKRHGTPATVSLPHSFVSKVVSISFSR